MVVARTGGWPRPTRTARSLIVPGDEPDCPPEYRQNRTTGRAEYRKSPVASLEQHRALLDYSTAIVTLQLVDDLVIRV